MASGIAVQSEQEITTLELTDTYNAETRRGDLVMPEQDAMLPTLFIQPKAMKWWQVARLFVLWALLPQQHAIVS